MIPVSNPELQTSRTPPGESSLFQRRVITPVIDLLRMGCSPRKLAWSIAVGLVLGLNPLLGSTTVVSLVLAALLRLNLLASQIANHLVYPLQLALFLVFIRIGDWFFHTGKMPMEGHTLFQAVRHHPWTTTKLLWTWEWHALIVWGLFAAIATPALSAALTPMLQRLHGKVREESVAA